MAASLNSEVINYRSWQFTSNGVITDCLKIVDASVLLKPSALRLFLDSLPRSFRPYPGVIIRVAAASLNPVDYKMIQPGSPNFLVRKPGIPGSDFSGFIVGWLGKKDSWSTEAGLHVGSRVYGHLSTEWRMLLGTGTFSEYIIAYPPMILPIPTGLSFQQSSSIYLAAVTSWEALVDYGKLKPKQRVFINGGSGGTGVWGIQIAKALGAYVVSTCSASSRELLYSLQVDEAVNYQTTPLIPHLSQHYSRPSAQFDIIFDCIGSVPQLFDACPSFLRPGGTYVDITSLANSKGIPGHVADALKVARNVALPTMLGGTPRKYMSYVLRASTTDGKSFKEVDALLRSGKVRPVVDSEYTFEDTPSAIHRLMSGRTKGKIVVRISEELCRSQSASD